MSIYFTILKRKIERKTASKEEVKKDVALWQAYDLIGDEEFMQLMELIETNYPTPVVEESTPA